MTTPPLLTAAQAYIARGWHVFVLSPTKQPLANCRPCRDNHTTPADMEACDCLTCHGFYAATTSLPRIQAMLDQHPGGLLAIRTGTKSRLAVVDIDFRTLVRGEPARDDPGWLTMCALDRQRLLPGTLMQYTGSGGLHLLYRHPGGYLMSGAAKYGPGVDSKADGGYIVVAPSVSAAGPYTWTPAPLRPEHQPAMLPDALAARVRPPAPAARRAITIWSPPGTTANRLAGLVRVVLESPDHTRNDRLHWAAKKAGEMIAAGEITEQAAVDALTDAATAVGLTTNEIGDATRGTIGSGMRKTRATAA